MTKSKGLGDTISKITEATGIKSVVDKISEVTGVPCNCEKRKKALNKLFPYARVFTEDEIKIYEEVLPRIKNTISRNDQQILLKIYNSVFNDNKKMTSCGSCINSTLNKLKQVYDKSCKI